MQFCPNCGARLAQPNPTFCPACGQRLIAAADQPAASRRAAKRQGRAFGWRARWRRLWPRRQTVARVYAFVANDPLLFGFLLVLSAFVHVWPVVIAVGVALVCPLVFGLTQFGYERRLAQKLGQTPSISGRPVPPSGEANPAAGPTPPLRDAGAARPRHFALHFHVTLEWIVGLVALIGGFGLYHSVHTAAMAGLTQQAAVMATGSLTADGVALVIGEALLRYGVLAFIGGGLKGLWSHHGGGFFKGIGLLGLILATGLVLFAYANPTLAGISSSQTVAGTVTSGGLATVYAFAQRLPLYATIVYGLGIALNVLRR